MSDVRPQLPRFVAAAMPQRDPLYPEVYANQLRMGITLSDFTLVFSTSNERTNAIEDKATVRLAPLTAKLLLQNLQMVLSVYEEKFGAINIPPKMMAQMEEQRKGLRDHLSEQLAPPTASQS